MRLRIAVALRRVDVGHAEIEAAALGGNGEGPIALVDVPRSLADDGNRALPRSEWMVSHGPPGGLPLSCRCRLGKAANGTLIRISPIADRHCEKP